MKRFKVKPCREKGYRWLVRGKIGTRRYSRTYFHTQQEAQGFADKKNIEFENKGTESLAISTATRLMAQEAELALQPYRKTIRDAVAFYLEHLNRVSASKTVRAAVAEFLRVKVSQKRVLSFRYRKDLKNRLEKFAGKFGTEQVANVSGSNIEDWLRGMNISGVTHDNYHRILSVFFSWALKAKLVGENPIAYIRDPEPITKTPGVFTPEEAERLLNAAPAELVPYLAFSLFCGIRPEEFHKTIIRRSQGVETREVVSLDWNAVDLNQKIVIVSSELAKTHRKRVITIPENLIPWVSGLWQRFGPVAPIRFREKLEKLRREIALKKWPHDVLRHSYCTYHLAQHKNEHLTAQQAGNSPQILRKHYDAVATPEDAKKFFSLIPVEAEKLISFSSV